LRFPGRLGWSNTLNEKADKSGTLEGVPSDQSDSARIDALKARLKSLIDEHFAGGAQALYLARLGSKLNVERADFEKLTGTNLSRFVRENFDYKIESTGEHKNILYLVSPDIDAHAAPETDAPSAPVSGAPWFMPRFWAAFATPLADGQARCIDLKSLKWGEDEASLAVPDADVRHIDAKFIATSTRFSVRDTILKIRSWLDEQHLSVERFTEKRARQHEPKSTLHILIEALEPEARRRLCLPLDIVNTLLEHRR
jgi:hypothetical protein